MKRLLLLDGNSILNRAFYGGRPLSLKDGTEVGAVYTFLTILLRFAQEVKPSHLGIAFDRPEPTFRHLEYKEYKGTRGPADPALKSQFPLLKQLLDQLGLFHLEKAGYEADDLIGTLAKAAAREGAEVFILSGDRDLFQLIEGNIQVLMPGLGGSFSRWDLESLRKEYRCSPEAFIDYKALIGDSSDNIKGITGIGKITGSKLIERYGSIEGVYAHLGELKPKMREHLREEREQLDLARRLVRIDTAVPLEHSWEETQLPAYPRRQAEEGLQAFAFRSLLHRMPALYPSLGTEAKEGEKENFSLEEGGRADQAFSEGEGESATKDPVKPERPLVSLDQPELFWEQVGEKKRFALLPGESGFVIIEAEQSLALSFSSVDWPQIHQHLREKSISWICFQAKALLKALDAESVEGLFDVATVAYALGKLQGDFTWEEASRALQLPEIEPDTPEDFHLLEKAEFLLRAQDLLQAEVENRSLQSLLEEVDYPLLSLLLRMEKQGVYTSEPLLREMDQRLAQQVDAIEQQVYAVAGESFNLNSPKQLSAVLFDRLGLPPGKKLKTGYSTAQSELENLRSAHPIIPLILQYRELSKLLSTFVVGLQKARESDGRIRSSFHATLTATGRLSSSEPNLQNIPVRTAVGRELRAVFCAPEGSVLLDADYSQIELRLLAHLSGDEQMITAFCEDVDIHRKTAARLFSIPEEEVTPSQRAVGKTINFSVVYGISSFGLSQDLGISIPEASRYIQEYYARYPKVQPYLLSLIQKAKEVGYVETAYGRRRYIPELRERSFHRRSFGERAAMNTPIQGTAADLIRMAMVRVDRRLRQEGLAARLVLQIHDELLVECPEAEVEQASRILQEEMEGVAQLKVPLVAEVHGGKNWLEAK